MQKLQELSNTTFTKRVKSVSKIIIVVPEAGLTAFNLRFVLDKLAHTYMTRLHEQLNLNWNMYYNEHINGDDKSHMAFRRNTKTNADTRTLNLTSSMEHNSAFLYIMVDSET